MTDHENALSRTIDPLEVLGRQDLDPLSVAELQARIDALTTEITRTSRKMEGAVSHRAGADALFKRETLRAGS